MVEQRASILSVRTGVGAGVCRCRREGAPESDVLCSHYHPAWVQCALVNNDDMRQTRFVVLTGSMFLVEMAVDQRMAMGYIGRKFELHEAGAGRGSSEKWRVSL